MRSINQSRSLRLIFLVTEDWYFVSHRLELAVACLNSGYDVWVITNCTNHLDSLLAAGCSVLPFKMNRRGVSPLGLIREIFTLARMYQRLKPHVVHHVSIRPSLVGSVAAKLTGVKHVVSEITGMGFLYTSGRLAFVRTAVTILLGYLLRSCQVIVQNSDDKEFFIKLGLPIEKLHLIKGSGVNNQKFRPCSRRDGTLVVMFAGRMLWDKGVREFVEAAAILTKSGHHVRFVLVGAPDRFNPTSIPETQLKAWDGKHGVEWWGFQEDMQTVWRSAHIACLPSYREGMPKSLLEASACGIPIVTTDVQGCRDVVQHGVQGLLVPEKNAEALARALDDLIRNSNDRRRMGEQARLRALSEFSQLIIIPQVMAIYRGFVGIDLKPQVST
jgi:glycosyltransferase involved in cell wall biosynthesis